MARSRTPRTRYRAPSLVLLQPIAIRPLRDQSRMLVGDLSSIFGIELIERAPRASLDDLAAFMDRVAPAPAPAPAPVPSDIPAATRVQPSHAPRDVPAAVAAWKALPDGAQVTCARGHKWTAKRSGGRLTFGQIKPSGRAGRDVEQPWFPLIMSLLPVWPVPFGDPQQGAPAAPAHLAPLMVRPAKNQPTLPRAADEWTSEEIRAYYRPAKNQPTLPRAADEWTSEEIRAYYRPAKNQPTRPPAAEHHAAH